jgi:hypothetical protein
MDSILKYERRSGLSYPMTNFERATRARFSSRNYYDYDDDIDNEDAGDSLYN